VWWTHAVGLVGTLLLAYPVLRLDQLGARLSRIERAAPAELDDERWAEVHAALLGMLQRQRTSWSPLNRAYLWLGYTLLAGSQAVRLFLTS
jgi:hypothetical protein